MLSQLTSEHYLSQRIFDLERDRIFRRLWLFAGFRTSIAEPGAFLTRTMAGLPVLLQNCDGDIRAFENLCPHRQMPLQRQPFGQARMVCPYHGWVFDHDGKVKSIPHEATLYAYTPVEREALCLKRYAVEIVGNMVFVNLAPSPMAIGSQFTDDFLSVLAEASGHFATLSVHVDIPVRYNWKLNYENVLDANHIPYIHPKSFQTLLRDGERRTAQEEEPNRVPHDEPAAPGGGVHRTASGLLAQSLLQSAPMRIDPWPWHDAVHRYGSQDCFYTFSIFPNVNFISPGGLTFIAQQFEPLAPGLTQLRMTLTIAKEKRRVPGLPALLRTYLKGEASVLNEDIAYLEALQARLYLGAPRAQHGQYEHRLQSAAQAYLYLLGQERAA